MKVMVPKTKLGMAPTVEFIKSPIQLTISLLVSNRIGSIRKCMESLKLILDAIPSELIAVDTVGEENSDGSLAVVKEYTDKIVHFDWNDDFSAARNAGLEQARGEWFLYVDDDEWFEDPTELIEFFQSGDYLKYGCTQYVIRSYTDKEMTQFEDSWVSRMGRRTKEMRFIHPVHEMLRPMYAPEKKFSKLYAHHVGYVFDNEQDKKKHFERNITPILEELKCHPDNLRLTMQAIQEYMFDDDYEKAEELCRGAESNEDPSYDLVWNWIMVMLLRTLIVRDRTAETIMEGRRILKSPRINKLARMNIDYVMMSASQKLNDPKTEIEFAEEYSRLAHYFDEHPEKAFDLVILSLGEILKEDKRKTVHNSLFLNYKNLQCYEELCAYSDSIHWNAEYMKQKLHFLFLLEAVSQTGHYDCLTRTVEKICQQGEFPADWMQEIQKVCNCEDKEKRYSFRKAFASVNSQEKYFLILKASCAEYDGGNVQAALQECLDFGLDGSVPNQELLGICLRTGVNPTPFLETLYMEDWVLSFSQLVKNTPYDDLQYLLDGAQKTLKSLSGSQYFVLCKMIHERILYSPDFPDKHLWKMAGNYAGDILGYYRHVYQERVLLGKQHDLPREAAFALQLEQALQAKEHGDLHKTLEALKQCVRAYPPRKDLIKRLLDQTENEVQQQNERQKEFSILGEQIKKQIYHFISLGQNAQAHQILEQLRRLNPEDEELEMIAQKISGRL